jgi:hypothetical protein
VLADTNALAAGARWVRPHLIARCEAQATQKEPINSSRQKEKKKTNKQARRMLPVEMSFVLSFQSTEKWKQLRNGIQFDWNETFLKFSYYFGYSKMCFV